MKNLKIPALSVPKLGLLALTAALAVPTFLATTSEAHADHKRDHKTSQRWNNRPNKRPVNRATTVDFRGTVTRGSNSGRFSIRADNRRTYTVQSNGRTVRGQRLRVQGQLRGGIVYATNVDRA
jgi:hypothetical protein